MDHALPADALPDDVEPCCPHCVRGAADGQTGEQMRMLRRLAEIGMDMVERVHEQVRATRWVGTDDTYNMEILSRGVRRTIALQAKLLEDQRKRDRRGAAGPARHDRPDTAPHPETARPAAPERAPAENLLVDMHERLDDPVIAQRPAAVIVAGICRDFGIAPDMSVWAEETPQHAADGAGDDSLALTPALSRDAGEGVQPPPVPGLAAGPDSSVARGGPMAPRAPRVATGHDPP